MIRRRSQNEKQPQYIYIYIYIYTKNETFDEENDDEELSKIIVSNVPDLSVEKDDDKKKY